MKKIILSFIVSAGLSSFVFSASGGPDAYGYTWKDSNEPTGPVYNWVDISSFGTYITGLADDNSHPNLINIGFNFHYYWSDYTKVKVGSNGWISFDNPGNIASCFPYLPTPGGAADNIVAPFMSDLNFAGVGNPGAAYYWTNLVDTFIIQYSNVPYWTAIAPNYTAGTSSFQIILSAVDSSITFQYQTVNIYADNAGCNDMSIGIENMTGNIGLECYADVMPPANYAIKFYYPDVVTFVIPDATPFWNQNTASRGEIYGAGSVPLRTNVKNVGNSAIGTSITVDAEVRDIAYTLVHSATGSVASLNSGQSSIVNFTPATLNTAGQYYFITNTTNASDINPSNNQKISELVVINACSPTTLSYHSNNIPDQQVSWNAGIGGDDGMAVFYKPPVYPVTINSLEFYIMNALGDGFVATIYADDGGFGAPGTILSSVPVAAGSVIGGTWNVVTLPVPVQIDSAGFYVAFFQNGPNIYIGLESTLPFSRNNYEILDGAWSEYRENSGQDAAFRVNITPPGLVNTTAVSGLTITANQAGATYQWLDCNNAYAPISGETGQSYTATANGSYAVALNFAGCLDTSACVVINNFGIEESLIHSTKVYPNPAETFVTIEMLESVGLEQVQVLITDVSGKIITVPFQAFSSYLKLNVESMTAGMYTYRLVMDNRIVGIGRFIKQ